MKQGKSILESRPDLLNEWDYEKNAQEGYFPESTSFACNKKRYWVCSICGYNDLKTRYPEIAKEWHPTKNGNIIPNQVVFGTNNKYWWKCNTCGGEWESTDQTKKFGGSVHIAVGNGMQ